MGSEGTSGMVINDSETIRLDNLETVVICTPYPILCGW